MVGHLTYWVNDFIFSFHMPLFFIVAGYLYRPRPLKETLRKDAKRLLLPYFTTASFLLLFAVLLGIYLHSFGGLKAHIISILFASGSRGHSSIYWAKAPAIGAIWFLWAMFWCKTTYNLIEQKSSSKNTTAIICVAVSAAAIAVDRLLINLPLALLPGLGALIFYWAGRKLKELGGYRQIPLWILAVGATLWCVSFLFFKMSMVRCYYQSHIICILGAIGGVLCIWAVLDAQLRAFKLGGVFLSYLGSYSLAILCFHLIDLNLPIRGWLGIPFGWPSLVFNILFILAGIIIVDRIPFLRTAFGMPSKPKQKITVTAA